VCVKWFDQPPLAGCARVTLGRPEDTDVVLDHLRRAAGR
jgi:hypothetical protein